MTDLENVRLLIGDSDPADQVFTDAQIQGFLDLRDGAVRLAAADALFGVANKLARQAQLETIGDYTLDTRSRASMLQKQAEALVSLENDSPAWGIAQENLSIVNERTIILSSFVKGI